MHGRNATIGWALAAATSLTSVCGEAQAAPPGADGVSLGPLEIVGGSEAQACEWPSVVALADGGGLCTGTLIHPRVVAYAAHCGTFHTKALFGEDIAAPAREVDTLHCERFSELFAVSSMDYAFCVLAEPVEDVEITPLLVGCDEALIEIGTPVTIVGFGDTLTGQDEQIGIKHAAQAEITGFLSTVGIGGMGVGADSGDSGGPALVELPDGSFRVLGLVSGGGGDGGTVQYVPAPVTVAWIEDRTGIDVTPCHDPRGSWAPTPACEGFFAGGSAGASWAAGCPGLGSGPSQRCGPPWIEIADAEAPQVEFLSPMEGELFDQDPAVLEVSALASDVGLGVREIALWIDGEPWLDALGQPAIDEVPPYLFEEVGVAGPGPHLLELRARDHADQLASAQVSIVLGEQGGEEETGSSDEESGSGDETGEGEETGKQPPEGGARGCSTAAVSPVLGLSLGWLLALGFAFGLGPRRRRREALEQPGPRARP